MIPKPQPSQLHPRRSISRGSRTSFWWIMGPLLLLSILVGTDLLTSLPVIAATTQASGKLPIPQASFTLQQFLKQGHPYQPKDAPLVLSQNPPALPRGLAQPKKLSTLPAQSSEPASMKAVSQTLSSGVTPSPTTTAGVAAAPVSQPAIHLVGSDPKGVRLEVLIPAGALDLSQATTTAKTAPQGALTIALTQLHMPWA